MIKGGGGGGGGEGLRGMMSAAAMQMSAREMGGGGGGGGGRVGKEVVVVERVPQWGAGETRDLISVRAELERDFTISKRNKTLWEVVAARMRERGHRRSPDQCKCKWKNLLNRYKGKETSDPNNGRECPFFEELHAVFTERARNMQRLLLESESGSSYSKKKLKRLSRDRSSDEFSEEEEDDDDKDDERPVRSRKKKVDGGHHPQKTAYKSKASESIVELLQEFFLQQQRMEVQWQEMIDRRAQERRMFEQEWRQMMEKLERERILLEQSWRQREEERRNREEDRAGKRDQLLIALFNKLIQEDL